jgi:hypothetical protein
VNDFVVNQCHVSGKVFGIRRVDPFPDHRDRLGFFGCVVGRELASPLKALLLLVGRRERRRGSRRLLGERSACTEDQRESKASATQ